MLDRDVTGIWAKRVTREIGKSCSLICGCLLRLSPPFFCLTFCNKMYNISTNNTIEPSVRMGRHGTAGLLSLAGFP